MLLKTMTDLECVDNYIEKSRDFIDPKIFREINQRGLYQIINLLPNDAREAKAIARAHLSKTGKYFGDEQIDQIAGTIQRLEFLRANLNSLSMTDCDKTFVILSEMKDLSIFVKEYFNKINL